jgi:hypothetical protein
MASQRTTARAHSAIAGTDGRVLIAEDLPHLQTSPARGLRVLFTFAGIGIAVVVMVLGNLLQKRIAKSAQPATAS